MNSQLSAERLLELADLSWDYKPGEVHDDSHSFNDLYNHRDTLFLCLLKLLFEKDNQFSFVAFKSELHSDGTSFEGYFIVVLINLKTKEQISYHLDNQRYWDICPADSVARAPIWDNHSSDDVIERLIKWFL